MARKPRIDRPLHTPRRVARRLARTNERLTTQLIRNQVMDLDKLTNKEDALETVKAVQAALEEAYHFGRLSGLATLN